jgi:hypothetical protein
MPILLAMRPVDDVLLKAAFKGDLGEVHTQIKKEADVNAANTFGFTPLLVAIKKGHQEVVALLLDHGAEVTQATTDGESPLYVAAGRKNGDILNFPTHGDPAPSSTHPPLSISSSPPERWIRLQHCARLSQQPACFFGYLGIA